jgi:hypothetical protein
VRERRSILSGQRVVRRVDRHEDRLEPLDSAERSLDTLVLIAVGCLGAVGLAAVAIWGG